jgi:cell division transport system permease protein
MIEWLLVSPAERRLLGAKPLRGPTPWVIAIMTFSIMIVAAAGLALASTASRVSRSAETRYSIQIPAGARTGEAVLAVVRSMPGVAAAQAVPESEMRKTLERWLGPQGASANLPVPALVTIQTQAGFDSHQVERKIAAIAPGAKLIAHRDTLDPLLRSLRALQWLALALVLLLAGACGAAVVLAARGALDTHRFTIEVMHGVGATDVQVTRLFQRKIAFDALAGSVAGAAAAALVLLMVGAGASFMGELLAGSALSGIDLLVLAAIPIALTMIATWVARTAVLAALRQAL